MLVLQRTRDGVHFKLIKEAESRKEAKDFIARLDAPRDILIVDVVSRLELRRETVVREVRRGEAA